jgi:putative SOS response-associated peptidase YedK
VCSNYKPVTRADLLKKFFNVEGDFEKVLPAEAWPMGLAPFIRLSPTGQRMVEAGHFGLLPRFAKEVTFGRKTYNARSETVHELPSFRAAWKKSQRCIIPAELIYEPCWETGKAVRWAIYDKDRTPMGIAGIYDTWRDIEGKEHHSFAMLTVNGAGHPIYQRMHRPQDEKRMVVILNASEYDDWLTCSPEEAPRYFKQWGGLLEAEPRPLPPRTKRPRDELPPGPVEDPGLF